MLFECNTLGVSGYTSLSLFHGDLNHHPLVPSHWLKRDSWHHLSAAGSPRWEQMADTACRGQTSCRECQQNCFQFCFIQNVLDASTRFKNCSYKNQTFLKSVMTIKQNQSNACPHNMWVTPPHPPMPNVSVQVWFFKVAVHEKDFLPAGNLSNLELLEGTCRETRISLKAYFNYFLFKLKKNSNTTA